MHEKIINIIVALLIVFAGSQTAAADVCWKASYGRGVGVIPQQCNYDQRKSGLLCYPPCKDKYTLVAGVCWQQCASGYRDDGAFCFKPNSYGRGAGYPIWDKGRCENDQGRDSGPTCEPGAAGTWNPKCKSGYNLTPNGSCAPTACPPGTEKDSVYPSLCKKLTGEKCPLGFDEYSNKSVNYCRFGFYLRKSYNDKEKDKCENENRIERCEQSGALHYPKCKPGFHAVGCCVCSPDCQPGTKDIGVSCQKDSYVVPPITPNCGTQQYDAGLCYNKCNAGFYGIGPVCWGQCPKGMVDCGAMCGSSAGECASAIGDMVLSVGKVIANITQTVLTFGATTSINEAAEAALDSAASAMKSVVKSAAKQFAGLGQSQVRAKIAGQLKDKNLPPAIADKLADMQANPDKFDYISFIKGLDPTGIVKVVDAFNKRICEVGK